MSRIAEFKNGHVAVPFRVVKSVPRPDGHGGKRVEFFTYPDGRTCKHGDGVAHDCAYVDSRNALIPAAARNAAAAFLPDDPSGMKRTALFLAEMTKLWEARR